MKTIFTLEGPDACGKTSHTNLLKEKFNNKNISTIVFHHKQPTNTNTYLDFFEQRKIIFNEFLESNHEVLVMDRNIYSSITLSATENSEFDDDNNFKFSSDMYVRLNEIKEEIKFINSIKNKYKENIHFNTLIIKCSDSILDERMNKRGEKIINRDYLVRKIYSNVNSSLTRLKNIYEINSPEFEYLYINYLSQTKEEFSTQIYNFFKK